VADVHANPFMNANQIAASGKHRENRTGWFCICIIWPEFKPKPRPFSCHIMGWLLTAWFVSMSQCITLINRNWIAMFPL